MMPGNMIFHASGREKEQGAQEVCFLDGYTHNNLSELNSVLTHPRLV